ncbi:MAG: CaiB/BaiF CoA transferase family protein [Candidatus Bathyarchaeia archaeon]
MREVLNNVRVLDLTRLLPGDYCTMLLSDFGADIIKIEEPTKGDYIRDIPPFTNGYSVLHVSVNRNKKSMTLNLKSRKGVTIFNRLARDSDVIVEGFRPGVVKRLGIDYRSVRRIKPDIIYCSITGYGQTGPYRKLVGHDINYCSIGGLLGLSLQKPPSLIGTQIADLVGGGIFAATAILLALISRNRTGKGQYIDTSMVDGIVSLCSPHLLSKLIETEDSAHSMLSGDFPCYNVYKTRDDQYFSIGAVEDKFWRNLCTQIGKQDFAKHQWTADKKRSEIFTYLSSALAQKTRKQLFHQLSQHDISVGPVYTSKEVFGDPQINHRKLLLRTKHRKATLNHVRNPMRLSLTPARIKRAPPTLGQHTNQILAAIGYTKRDIQRFRDKKIL